MKPVYPLEVAFDLGKQGMVNMLLEAGAKPIRSSPPGRWIQTLASLCGKVPDKDLTDSDLAPSRSCLSAEGRDRWVDGAGDDGSSDGTAAIVTSGWL
eukprot:Skav223389  [mRNA]  locus=scaffold2634:420855:421145:- [translate_table: standard]